MRLLYIVSDFLYLLVYYIIPYRKDVVRENIDKSFPELSEAEKTKITKRSYAHFCDLIIESVKNFSISESQVVKRSKIVNPELLNQFAEQGRSVILVLGHYANWEIMAVSGDLQLNHQVTILFHPLQNKFFNHKVHSSRSQYGSVLIPKNEVNSHIANVNRAPLAMVFVADQSPIMKKGKNIYWTKFMNQDTPIVFGPEKYARRYNLPVVFAHVSKVKRGYYEASLELIEENPQEVPEHEITEKHVRILESQIRKKPDYYLWTHRRWKHKKPVEQ